MVPMLLHKADTHETLERHCAVKGLSVKALQAGSRDRVYSSIRRELAGKFVLEMGLSHADAARLPGISRAGVSMLGASIKGGKTVE